MEAVTFDVGDYSVSPRLLSAPIVKRIEQILSESLEAIDFMDVP
ncbi:hypothetical protein OH492_14400 [Vibrio chagasii]|nr:hypothetical protein [Vibrio chagasii]